MELFFPVCAGGVRMRLLEVVLALEMGEGGRERKVGVDSWVEIVWWGTLKERRANGESGDGSKGQSCW